MSRKFVSSTQGSVLPIVAIGLVAILGAAGAALDYSVVSNARSSAQNVADSMSLATAEALANGSSRRAALKAGKAFYEANSVHIASSKHLKPNIEIKLDSGAYSVSATISGVSPTNLMSAIGIKEMQYSVTSTAQVELRSVEVAFVADVSNSMQYYNRLWAAKKGMERFIDSLYPKSVGNSSRKVSIIPYSDTVNLGSDYSDWLKPDSDGSNEANFVGCFQHEPNSQIQNLKTGHVAPGTYLPYISRTYSGAPTCPPASSQPLFASDDPDALKARIRNLRLGYGTSTDVGLLWGWRALSPAWTKYFKGTNGFSKPYSDDNLKYIIVMTDGEAVRTDVVGDGNKDGDRKDRVRLAIENFTAACKTIKSHGQVHVFTISYDFNGKEQSTLAALKNCVAGEGRYYNANTGNIRSILEEIGHSINRVRITS